MNKLATGLLCADDDMGWGGLRKPRNCWGTNCEKNGETGAESLCKKVSMRDLFLYDKQFDSHVTHFVYSSLKMIIPSLMDKRIW